MKIMRFKNVILILFCFWLTAFFGQNVIACSCGGRLSTAEAFEKAKIVFVGEVVKVIESPLKTSSKKNPDGSTTVSVEMDSPTIFKISVKKAFRGIETETVEFVQSRGDSCAYPFSKGESYLIFATLEGGKLQTDKCSNTNLLSKSIEAVKFIEGWGNKNLQTLIS